MRTKKKLFAFRNGGWGSGCSGAVRDSEHEQEVSRWARRARQDWKQARALMRQARAIRDGGREGPHFGTIVSLALGFRKSAHRCQEKARANPRYE